MTGREAVEYFAKLHHIGKIQSIYFNKVENRHYRPYDLRSVAKNKADPEHYVFSTFGVLHVYPDQPNESLSLSEWQREAVLWTAVSSIPFFKQFLIRKMFRKWRYNKRYLDFLRRQDNLTATLLPAVPAFGAAILQVSRLLKELITVKFLPFDVDKAYQLSEFENYVNYKNIQAEKFLEKFFRYCKMVMDVTAEESFKKLKYCEDQVKKKTVFSKDSLHMQRVKKENRAENLRKARSETGRLGNFVKLVDQVIVEHMFSICKNQVISFVDKVLKIGDEAPREGFFKANLILTKQDVLGLSPPPDRFIKVLASTLKGIPTVLTSNAIPIDGSVPPDQDTLGDDTESSAPTKSDAAKSVENVRIAERRKSTAKSSLKQDSHYNLGDRDKAMSSQATPAGETTAGETTTGEATDVESQVGISKSVLGDDGVMLPDLPRQETVTKEQDLMGVATPDLVVRADEGRLVVMGEGFMGQYDPLSRANLEDKLDKDTEYQQALEEHSKIICAGLEEIDQYCERASWIHPIHNFCKKWNDKSLKEFKGMAAYTIEQRLTELRQWSERIRNFDKSFCTENNLFYIDCIAIHEVLLPRLNDIYQEVVTFVAEEAKTLATSFCEEMEEVLQNMKDKRASVDAFARFAKNFNIYKKNAPQYQQRMEYIKSLFEVVRMGYRQLSPEEEKNEENVSAAGEAFMLQMQDASEFVNTQTPLMTKLLEDTFQRMAKAKTLKQKVEAMRNPSLYMRLEKQVLELSEKATHGKFLDTNQDPTAILQEMRGIRDQFFDVLSRLRQASRWREAICGEAYNLDFLEDLTTKMNVRQEVWKYVEVTRHSIDDWKATPFRKMNIKKALEKLFEWQSAAAQLKPYLPQGDQVLGAWFHSMSEFKKNLPVLHKLANEALKERHWKAIFVGMNETYDNMKQYTVADLLAYDLEEHAQLIHNIYLGAIEEFDLEVKITQISKLWEEREFKLAKHIPDSVISSKDQKKKLEDLADKDMPKKPSSPRRRTKLEKYRQERAAAQVGEPQGLNVRDDDFFILIEVDDLKYQLQHSRISIKSMMQSPYLGDMSLQVEYWHTALQQVEEITDLWYTCQKKWLYLLKIFERAELYKKFQAHSHKFETLHGKFKDWMRVVSNDSKILTVVHRKRGEKGYRLLQGDNLRALFLQLIESQEEILKHLEGVLETSRMEFPRLYFLSNDELIDLLGISRNPKMMLPTAKKCFPGVESLTFDLPPGTSSISTELDFALNADKLEVTTMHGALGEEVPLYTRVQAFPRATRWFKSFEAIMKNTMALMLQKCIQARMEEGSRQPIHLLEEIGRLAERRSSEEERIAGDIKLTFRHWLLRFPVQCVLVAESLMWARAVNKALENGEADELHSLQSSMNSKYDQYIDLIRESYAFNGSLPASTKQRLHRLLCNLISQTIHQRDVLECVLSSGLVGTGNFEWLREMHYHIDIQTILRAKREELEIQPAPPTNQAPVSQRKAGRGRRTSKTLATKVRVETTIEEPPKLTRTKTVVSTDYQFGMCCVQQLGNTFHYDYEYQGPVSRLVLTPLTHRAFLSLTQSLQNYHAGTLVGPPGTGKSETIKELSKIFGCAMLTVNCNEEMTVGIITQIMLGTVQSGCWTLFDDTDRLTQGLMSVAAQHLDYLRTALRTLQQSSENQYKIRGQARPDKGRFLLKTGVGDKVIRRNSLTTLHPLPSDIGTAGLQRQNTVPHGFNEKGLVTYFEDTWVAEKDLRRRRHSIEKEIDIKESDLYKSNKPPPLFYEYVRSRIKNTKPSPEDYSRLNSETVYTHHYLGNIMFSGKLVHASANFGCFMTLNTQRATNANMPEVYRLLMRPCAMIVPDKQQIAEVLLCNHGFRETKHWARKIDQLLSMLKIQLPRKNHYHFGVKDLKTILTSASNALHNTAFCRHFAAISEPNSPRSSASTPTSHKSPEPQSPRSTSSPSPRVKSYTTPQTASERHALEEHCLVHGLRYILLPALETDDDRDVFSSNLRNVFPASANIPDTTTSFNTLMKRTVQDQLKEDSLTESEPLLHKILQLNTALQMKKSVILCGPAGSGKTTCCTTLGRAYNRLNYLLFAPDHSKDELNTDFVIQGKQKKKLKDEQEEDPGELADNEGDDEDEEEILEEMEKQIPEKKTTKKLRRMSRLLGKVSDAMQELQATRPKDHAEHPKVDIIRLSPTAFPPSQLLGCYKEGMWCGGLFPKLLQDSSFLSDAVKSYITSMKDRKNKGQLEIPSVLLRWIVLDGVMHPIWADSLNTLFDEEKKLSTPNSGGIHLQDTTALMFETSDLTEASPATVTRCSILHFSQDTVQWKSLFDRWLKTAKSRWVITSTVVKVWEELVRDVFGSTLRFLRQECCPALLTDVGHTAAQSNQVAPGIQEISTFLRYMTALLDKGFLREELEQREKQADIEETGKKSPTSSIVTSHHAVSRLTGSSHIEQLIPNYLEILKGVFAFSYIWGFGGHIHERFKDRFSKFAHDALYRTSHPVRIPMMGSVYDYCLDEQTGTFIRWSDKQQERTKIMAGGFTLTTEVEKYTYHMDLLLGARQPVLLAGNPGVGKTTLIQNMVLPKHSSTSVIMSRCMSSELFQHTMVAQILELKHKSSNVLSGPGGTSSPPKSKQYHLFFVDDLSHAQCYENYQPPLELLKQVLSEGGTYDQQRQEFQGMEEALFLAATTLPTVPGSGMGRACHVMSSRLTRLFVTLTLFTPALDGLLSMHGRSLQNWLEEFPTYSVEHHFEFARAMTLALLEMYHRIKEKFRATPANAHYIFTLHDISRVVHGILLMSPRSRTRKMMRRKKDGHTESRGSRSNQVSRQASWESRSRSVSMASGVQPQETAAPMMKVIAQLWCHECTRTFADRLVTEDDSSWFSRIIEDTVMKYFCMARDDPKTEMAAISEETVSQTGRVTPQTTSPLPASPMEEEEEETREVKLENLPKVEEVKEDEEEEEDTKSQSQTLTFSVSQSQTQSDDLANTTPVTNKTDGAETMASVRTEPRGESESEDYETECSEETEESSDTETTETETDTYDTPRDVDPKHMAHGGSTRRSSRESSGMTDSSTRSTDTSVGRETPRLIHHKASSESGRSSRGSQGGTVGGKVSTTPSLKPQGRSGHGSLKMKTVTFKAGLLADWEHEAYFGPLMSMEEIRAPSDSLTDFIFSKFFLTTHTETQGIQVEKGYVDSQEDVLADALNTCLNVYNAGTSQRLELVFFSEALRHAARLSRVLAIPGGHALLLGMTYSTGRATLVRLASYIAHCKKAPGSCCRRKCRGLFEPKPQTDVSRNHQIVREHIKRACHHTGILGKPTVLLIHEDLGMDCLADICCLMAEGTSPGLYTDDEVQAIVSQMMPGGVQTKRVDKIEQAFERYLKKIRQNLHIIVCLNYRGNSYSSDVRNLHDKLNLYPNLLKYASSVDMYHPWTYEAYVKIAEVWLQDQRSKISIPWHPTRMLDQMAMTSQAMAYMHLSAKNIIERQFCHQREPLRFYSPLTFMEFVHLFRVISAFIVKKERENIGKHEQALSKVNEAFGSINQFKRQVSALTPQHKAAMDEIKELVEQVEEHREQYIESLDKCKAQEQKIEELQTPLEDLRREAQTEFDKSNKRQRKGPVVEHFTSTQYKVNPNYQAALTALSVLHKKDLEEVRSYRDPPQIVQFVMKALCLLFNVPQDWENAKLLLIKENVVEDMMFYDKDNIPNDIFEQLGRIVQHPLFQPELIRRVSLAAAGVCFWVHAVYKYAHIYRNMQPRLKNLLEHEEKFTQAQAKLGQMRVEANRIKSSLETKIVDHKAAVKRAKTIEKHMQSIEKMIARACNLMENMSMQHYLWKSELKKAKNHVLTAPGDALVTAAAVLYHGPLQDKFRADLLQDWLDRCRQGNFTLNQHIGQERYPLNNILEGLEQKDAPSDSSQAGDSSIHSDSATSIPSLPEIRIYRYPPTVYDTRKYYKSELKKRGSIEYDGTLNIDGEGEDSDDEDDQSILLNRTGYILQEILSDFDELSKWRLDSLPTDLHSIQNALLMRVSCHNRKHCWPLLIDPDNQAQMWVRTLQTSRNIFSEKDLRASTPEDMDGIPLESSRDKESTSDPLPPSRGTILTFSDMYSEGQTTDGHNTTDGHTTDRTAYTSTSAATMTTDYTKSGGRHSRQTWNSEDLRPVTSVTNSWETTSLRADQNVDHPEHNLWIVEADDPSLDSKLINAIVHGITVLVTHLERKPLDPLFRGLLLKQFFVDKEGHKIIKVGSYEFRYHPNFCLYLSTSVPLFLKGDGLYNVPIHRMCIINLAMSDEAIINLLLIETMKIERKEFEGQKRSNENDIILHRQRLFQEHELIREKTLNLDIPILEDKTMLESLVACQKEVERNRLILEETRYMGENLEEKFANYMGMIMNSAVVYNTIKRMAVLHHHYYLPFYKFMDIFVSVLKKCYRGKGSIGAPEARAQELSDAMSSAIYKQVALMMFEQHFALFQLLVAMESMRLTRKTSTKELSLFINGFEKTGLDESVLLENKPEWLTNQAWVDCLVMEQLHHPFHGLRRSLQQTSSQWQEYFQHPVTLMNPVPGSSLQELTVFQKCILWKIVCPHRLAEIASALTLYELGSLRKVPDHYNIREVYSYIDNTTPAILVLPNSNRQPTVSEGTKGNTYVTPAHEIKRLAKEVGMDGKVKVMNFGVKGQTSEARHALEECIQNGYWLLLQNYHLAEEPARSFFALLKDIVYSKWVQHERRRQLTEVVDNTANLVVYSKPNINPDNDLVIHDTFRLWITTKVDSGRQIPGVLVQHGFKVTCEQTCNFKATLQKSYRSTAFLMTDFLADNPKLKKCNYIMPLALLHSLLLQQSFYGRNAFQGENFWTLTDLALAVDMFKKVMKFSHSVEGVKELVSKVYVDHCIDQTDGLVVSTLVSSLAEYATNPDKIPPRDKSNIVCLLEKLLATRDSFQLRRAVDSLEELSAKSYGLPESADTNVTSVTSRVLVKDLIQVTGAPELFQKVTNSSPSMGWYAEAVFPSLVAALQACPALPDTNRNQVLPLDSFLHGEVECYRSLLATIQADLALLQRRARGEILLSKSFEDVIAALSSDRVPEAWLAQTFPSATSFTEWINSLPTKIETLLSYLKQSPHVPTYKLSAFMRPDRFLEAIKQTHARKNFKDVNSIEFDVQVMPAGMNPSTSPRDGIFLTGLTLYNALWDTSRGTLMSNNTDSQPWQEMPVLWVKPTDVGSHIGQKYHLYQCPVFCTADSSQQGDPNLVTRLPVPTLDPPSVWHQARVFLISDV
ncbi:dynein heavy chain domain-containing protein 1-like isoform X1 [Argopecten irradians]|uniref:dynein heavy chain domain-containing protein 1-like isoform X1 n=1 Tax=Argopecten irradians TaxID=31199 RepID=UPI00372150D8